MRYPSDRQKKPKCGREPFKQYVKVRGTLPGALPQAGMRGAVGAWVRLRRPGFSASFPTSAVACGSTGSAFALPLGLVCPGDAQNVLTRAAVCDGWPVELDQASL